MDVSLTQKAIISKIKSLDDPSLLEAIESLISFSLKKGKNELSEAQKKNISESRNQISEGKFLNQDIFFSELKQWLKER